MTDFPTLSTGTTAFLPVAESVRYRTHVTRFLNDTEQRWRKQAALRRFRLTWTNLNRTDKNLIQAWFATTKGSFDATWTFPIGGVDWDYMAFEQDSLTITEHKPNYFTVSATFAQVRKN